MFEGDVAELHDHRGRSSGPVTRDRCRSGETRAGGGEEYAHHTERREQEVGHRSYRVPRTRSRSQVIQSAENKK